MAKDFFEKYEEYYHKEEEKAGIPSGDKDSLRALIREEIHNVIGGIIDEEKEEAKAEEPEEKDQEEIDQEEKEQEEKEDEE